MITKQEIKDLVFQTNTDLAIIRQNIIDIVILENVETLLPTGLDLSLHPNLQALVKPYIAYLVKAYLIDANQNKTGNKGTMKAQGSNEQSADEESAKRIAVSFADKFKKQIIAYLRSNELSDYKEPNNVINGVLII
jgi:hypothetical protein